MHAWHCSTLSTLYLVAICPTNRFKRRAESIVSKKRQTIQRASRKPTLEGLMKGSEESSRGTIRNPPGENLAMQPINEQEAGVC